jgi:hypothetical protein
MVQIGTITPTTVAIAVRMKNMTVATNQTTADLAGIEPANSVIRSFSGSLYEKPAAGMARAQVIVILNDQ